ncbi:MAG: AbrB/MazE/SpoVT family DNA-binding domain-containing protein [Verrucomicrobiae bacterium]|nr:AbrB/MazE/SpoVT family DNA-binding domain-containing protein [Verrucomicrobiae bacterium]
MTVIPLSKRGTLTIPPEFRRKLGLDRLPNALFIVEQKEGGLFLKPCSAIPVRNFPQSTLAKWIKEDEAQVKEFGLTDLISDS